VRKIRIFCDFKPISLLFAIGFCAIQTSAATGGEVIVSYSLVSPKTALHEPVILQFEAKNATDQPIQLDLGKDHNENFIVSFSGPGGAKGQSLRLRRPGFAASGKLRIEPGETYKQDLVLNAWIEFARPGNYEIEVHLAKNVEAGADTVIGMETFHTTVEIAAEDNERLKEVCASLAKRVQYATSYEEAATAARTLSFVKDPIAVPYLKTALFSKHLVEPITIDALEKIGDEGAVEVLISALTLLSSDSSALARAALERIGARSSDPSLKQEIERGLNSAGWAGGPDISH
jgi:hypothetical protein